MDDNWHPCCPPATGLVAPVRRWAEGREGPSAGRVRGPGFLAVSRGWHVPADTPRTPEQRAFEVGCLLPTSGMLTGWAALRLAGASYFEGVEPDRRTPLPVPVLLPHARRLRGPAVVVARTRRELPDPIVRYGVRCAPNDVALLHEIRRASSARAAGVMVDMALAAGVVERPVLRGLVRDVRLPAHATYALGRACAECRSPRESAMLQVWESVAGLPRPLMNREVRDLSGRLLAVVDLLDVDAGVCGEFNGSAHRSARRQSRDEKRHADLRAVGLETFAVVGSDSDDVQVERMHAARGRALWLPGSERRWRVGAFVPAPPLAPVDTEEAEREVIMLEHYAALEDRRSGEPSSPRSR
ncbi:hypothetical protein EUA93_09300 [Nocardioides oleivorans]|uniref:DUF559 domain-containing protein n=1 Tax=Nocardioides oleivorans TaxID=273676 RepID=A0A4Q2RYZ6_9ACTN|nr:hypothetical protein [Nocardioides oleivorans]RYB94521.1 hypothetical protein EUA93_09300 [Nocardioides oleivorans]